MKMDWYCGNKKLFINLYYTHLLVLSFLNNDSPNSNYPDCHLPNSVAALEICRMLNRSSYFSKNVLSSRIRTRTTRSLSESPIVRAELIQQLQTNHEDLTYSKGVRKSFPSFPDKSLRDLTPKGPAKGSYPRGNLSGGKGNASFGAAFDSLQKKEVSAQRIKRIIGKLYQSMLHYAVSDSVRWPL